MPQDATLSLCFRDLPEALLGVLEAGEALGSDWGSVSVGQTGPTSSAALKDFSRVQDLLI